MSNDVYYQTLFMEGASVAGLADSKDARNAFDNMLRTYGKQGWRAYQVEGTQTGLLVFLQRVDRADG